MNLTLVLAAFGGGVFGALIGALPAFIFAGFVGIVAVGIMLAGGEATFLNEVVFGYLFGPHIAFAGGVAAAAYEANKMKTLDSGMNILASPGTQTNNAVSLLVGGVFGIVGYLLNYLFATIIKIPIDTVALTVFTSGVIARFAFGNSGLFGRPANPDGGKREYLPDGKTFGFVVMYSLGVGIVISYLINLTNINVLGFVISAALLIFVQAGYNIPATHHVTLVAGYATIATGSIFVGALFAVIAGLVGEIAGRTFNNCCDTHIDPPATTIAICSLFIFTFLQ